MGVEWCLCVCVCVTWCPLSQVTSLTSLLHVAPIHKVSPGPRKRGKGPWISFKGKYQESHRTFSLTPHWPKFSHMTLPTCSGSWEDITYHKLPPYSSSIAPTSTSSPPPSYDLTPFLLLSLVPPTAIPHPSLIPFYHTPRVCRDTLSCKSAQNREA